MKFILTGCTGFIGAEVLSQCIRNPSVTSIIALSRRELPSAVRDPKLRTIIMNDFNVYPDVVMEEISSADACIWCMGTTKGDRTLEIDYPLSFGNAFSKTLSSTKKQFRYLHLSGGLTERDQNKSLLFAANMRRTKGEAEVNMIEFQKRKGNEGLWETVIVKPGFVITKEGSSPRDMLGWALGDKRAIRVDELAAMMIDVALNGSREETIQDNAVMVYQGRNALERNK